MDETRATPDCLDHQAFSIRPACYHELPLIAKLLTKAFWHDALFGDIIHPHRREFPADNELYWLRRAKVNWWDWSLIYLVSVVKDQDGKEVITGVALWARMGDEARRQDMKLSSRDPRRLLKPLAQAKVSIEARISPNRAASADLEDVLERSYHYLDEMWTGKRAESWYLESLAVDPDHHKQGQGRALVRWGFEQAEKDGICVSVISGDGKENFYRRCGFEVQDGWSGMGKGNPLAIAPGGLMFWKDIEY